MNNTGNNSPDLKTILNGPATDELAAYALQCLRSIYRKGFLYYKAGVILSDLVSTDQLQTDLFDSVDRNRSKRLMQALDEVNYRYGTGTLAFAAAGTERPWKTICNRRSPRYTTRWDELRELSAI